MAEQEMPTSLMYIQQILVEMGLEEPDELVHSISSLYSDEESSPSPANDIPASSTSQNSNSENIFVYDESLLPEDYNKICPICLGAWDTRSQLHYPVALKCKHVFGFKCIKEWLTQKSIQDSQTCPLCKKCVKLGDLKRVDSSASGFMSIQEEIEEERKNESKISAQNIRDALNAAGLTDSDIDDWVASELHDKFEYGLEGKWWVSREVIIDTKLLNFFVNVQFFLHNLELFKKHIDSDDTASAASKCKNKQTLKIIDVLLDL